MIPFFNNLYPTLTNSGISFDFNVYLGEWGWLINNESILKYVFEEIIKCVETDKE